VKAREVARMLERAGADLIRRDGDHYVYRVPGWGPTIALPMGGAQTEVCKTLLCKVRKALRASSMHDPIDVEIRRAS